MADSILSQSASDPAVDPDHPWLGLHPFTEANHHYFFGRTAEVREIFLRVRENPLTVLYGQSGLGKTSLLRASLIPKLRVERFRPVHLLLDFGAASPPLVGQVRNALADASAGPEADRATLVERWEPLPTLWEICAHETLRPPQIVERPLVLIFDQFEEVFTLGAEDVADSVRRKAEVAELVAQIGDLVENRAPRSLQEKFQGDPQGALAYDFGPTAARVLFSLREDFLAQLEEWKRLIPSLMRNRMQLRLLTGPQALEAVVRPGRMEGRNLVSDAVGERIVRFVARRSEDTPLEEIGAVPPLLSLLCERLNDARLGTRPPLQEVSAELVKVQGADILQRFYNESFGVFVDAEREVVREYIEDRMVTVGGHRNPVAREDAVAELAARGVSAPERVLDALIGRRLLTAEQRGGIQRVEITHDVLAPLVVRGRKERQERRVTEQAKRLQAEAKAQLALERQRRNQLYWVLSAVTILLFLALGALWFAFQQKSLAESEEIASKKEAHIATVQRFANDFWTPSSADRNILFACQLVKELSGRTENDPLRRGEAASVLNLALDRRKRLIETHWNFGISPANSNGVSAPPLYAVAYSSDGQMLLTGDFQGRVRVLRNGVLGEPITVSKTKIRTIAFSPDDLKAAVGASGTSVSILDLNPSDPAHATTQLELPEVGSKTTTIWSCSWNRGGDLAAATQEGTVYIWSDLLHSLRSGSVSPPLQLKNRLPVHAVAWDQEGSLLAIGDSGGYFRLWNKTALSEATKAHLSAIWGLAWSQDGRLACASWDCSISVWKPNSLQPLQPPTLLNVKLQAHSYWVRDVVWIDQDRTIASTGDDGTIRFWRSSDLDELGSEPTPTQALWKLSYSSTLSRFAAACNDGAIRIYQFNPPKTDTHGNHRNTITYLAFGRSSVLSFDQEGGVEDFDPASRADHSFQIPSKFQSNIQSVSFYAQHEALVIGYAQSFQDDKSHGELAVWRPRTDDIKFCSTDEPVGYVACHPTKSMVAFVTKSGAIGFKSLPELEPVVGLQDLPPVPKASPGNAERILSWSPTGDHLLTATVRAGSDSQICLFRFNDKGLTFVNSFALPARLSCVQWHPREPLVALGSKDGAIIVQPIDGLKAVVVLAHDKCVKTLNWSSDGHHLFTGGEDGTIKLWDYTPDGNKLTLVVTLRHPCGGVYAAGLSQDGKILYTAGNSSTVFHWPVGDYTLDSILARAQRMIHRNMLKSEWDRYTNGGGALKYPYEKTFDTLPALYLLKSP